jgi:DNA-binding PadR family transcriptional regulator
MTRHVAAVVAVLLEEPTAPHHGYELMRQAKIKSGTLYPLLGRLEDAGWVQAGWETDPPAGRPPRRYYQLTPDALAAARVALATYRQQESTAPVAAVARPATGGAR